jgi:hypothetical protein
MRLYQSTDSDRRANPTTCGADRRLETVFTMDPDGSGPPYHELKVTITVNGSTVFVDINTELCGSGVVVRHRNGAKSNFLEYLNTNE